MWLTANSVLLLHEQSCTLLPKVIEDFRIFRQMSRCP